MYTVNRTLKAIKKTYVRTYKLPLNCSYSTVSDKFRYNILRTKIYSDTLFVNLKSKSGNSCSQIFDHYKVLWYVVPMDSRSKVVYALSWCLQGIVFTIHICNYQYSDQKYGRLNQVLTFHGVINCTNTKTYIPFKIREEYEIQYLKDYFGCKQKELGCCPKIFKFLFSTLRGTQMIDVCNE